jgi:radical SAM superfamily enzyme YgiQ (UPF0313 family)
MDTVVRNTGADFFFFTDLTFNANHQHVLDTCAAIVARGTIAHWFAYASPVQFTDKVASAMRSAGCTKVGFGIESVLPKELSQQKPIQDVQTISQALRIADRHGLLTRCYLMIGWPEQDDHDLEATSQLLQDMPIDELRIGYAVPFPGTPFFKESRECGRVLTDDFSRYSGDEPVLVCQLTDPNNAAGHLSEQFYRSEAYVTHVADKCSRHPHLRSSFDEFFSYLRDRRAMDIMGLEDRL